MTNEQLAWAAGFFDGEGYVSIVARNTKGNSKQYRHQYIRIGINHVDPRPLQKFQQLFGGQLTESKQVIGNRKPRWQWILTCEQAKQFLTIVRPYLINKDIVADIAFQFLDTIGLTGQRISVEKQQIRHDCASRLKLVNSQT